jgi:hypothetical protein
MVVPPLLVVVIVLDLDVAGRNDEQSDEPRSPLEHGETLSPEA